MPSSLGQQNHDNKTNTRYTNIKSDENIKLEDTIDSTKITTGTQSPISSRFSAEGSNNRVNTPVEDQQLSCFSQYCNKAGDLIRRSFKQLEDMQKVLARTQ